MPARSLTASSLASSVDAVLFDMDGVLLDTEPLYTEATRRVLGARADEYTWDIKRQMMGRASAKAAQFLVETLRLDMTAEEYMRRKEPVLQALFTQSAPRPGAEALVRYLKSLGMKMAVATSSARPYFEIKTRNQPWFALFDAIVCGSDPEVAEHKPAPDIFVAAAKLIETSPTRCAIFEDSIAGIQAARRAGSPLVIALPDARMDESEIAEADYILSGFEQIALE